MSIEKKKHVHYLSNLFKQFLAFVSVSGIGFIIDLSVYSTLAMVFGLKVFMANIISAIPAITFVYFFSTKYIFKTIVDRRRLLYAYGIYVIYQIILLTSVSWFSQGLFDWMVNGSNFNPNIIKFSVKILITPITMTCNFFVMRYIVREG